MNGTDLRIKFDHQWGAFRKFIASRPLTGFWLGVGLGAGLGAIVARIAGG